MNISLKSHLNDCIFHKIFGIIPMKVITMAQEYIAIKQKNNIGVNALSTSVFQTIASIVIEEDEYVKLNETVSPFKYALGCKIQKDQLILTLDIKVKYNVNVNEICSKLQSKIFETIEYMSDYTPDVIDVRVHGFFF